MTAEIRIFPAVNNQLYNVFTKHTYILYPFAISLPVKCVIHIFQEVS